MATIQTTLTAAPRLRTFRRPRVDAIVMPIVLLVLGFYVIYPLVLILVNSFNVARARA